jgi:hypothetical protein
MRFNANSKFKKQDGIFVHVLDWEVTSCMLPFGEFAWV